MDLLNLSQLIIGSSFSLNNSNQTVVVIDWSVLKAVGVPFGSKVI